MYLIWWFDHCTLQLCTWFQSQLWYVALDWNSHFIPESNLFLVPDRLPNSCIYHCYKVPINIFNTWSMHPHNNSGHDAKFLSWAVSILCSGVPLLERSLISCLLSFAPGAMVANQSSARQVMRSIRSSKSDASYPVRCYPEALSWSGILKCCPDCYPEALSLQLLAVPASLAGR